MAKFALNTLKNTSIGHTFFKLYYSSHLSISFKKNSNSSSDSKFINILVVKLQKLLAICCENFFYTQKLQNRAHNKVVKPKNNTPNN